jgi:hypothetical protein
MESSGVPNEIQVSSSSYLHLQEKFLLERRGAIEIKGKRRLCAAEKIVNRYALPGPFFLFLWSVEVSLPFSMLAGISSVIGKLGLGQWDGSKIGSSPNCSRPSRANVA